MDARTRNLNPAQRQVVDHGLLTSGFSCILQMPTGSGKTWLAREAIAQCLAGGRRAIYLTPLRALAEELLASWQPQMSEAIIGIFTGDYGRLGRDYPVPYTDAQVLIMTPERLDACTRTWRSHWSWIPEVDLVVMDEVHLLGDPGRGARLEGAISRLRRLNPFCRFLGLSATLGNRAELADWFGGVEFGSDWRPVPLSWRVNRYRKADEKPELLARELAGTRASGGQSLVFVQSRRRSEALTNYLKGMGIAAAFHHAGLKHVKRKEVETDFRERKTPVLIATATLEMGMNLPARQVVLYDLQAFDGTMFSPLSTNTVWQRAGRAGRPGLDTKGEVVLFAPTWDRDAQHYPAGHFERIESVLSDPAALAEQILVEVQAGYGRSTVQLDRIFSSSLAAHQKKSLKLGTAITEMIEAGMLRIEREEEDLLGEETLVTTGLGRVATRHLLRPATILTLRSYLRDVGERTFFDILVLLATTDDCEPILTIDFEELDEFASSLSKHRSFLFGPSLLNGSHLVNIPGRRLLSAFKSAVALMSWTEKGDADEVAKECGCYSFEVLRLRESFDRLLLAASGVQKLLDKHNSDEDENNNAEKSPMVTQIELLRQMILNGLNERAASLTVIEGIGAKWARKLISAGIGELDALARCKPSNLTSLGGISADRAEKWIQGAVQRIQNCPQRPVDKAPTLCATSIQWRGEIDPYRLHRALELRVEQNDPEEWLVTGGSEPHRIWTQSKGWVCDCFDHAKGRVCKHVLAVKLAVGDKELKHLAAQLRMVEGHEHLDLFRLWFDRKGANND